MRISKDEAVIISIALDEYKYQSEIKAMDCFFMVEKLEHKIRDYSKDKRRVGRTRQDNKFDVLKRLKNRYR